ncbi:hypothetical protein L0666_09995 [Octadecabacter sp. CECT 8868]|uniref:hypothetical protein n=1 Tax=Octadecabacter algicola TaxID=2909342 RepID=UPI001F4756FC|nr:hypothetical protein [Octadecabacter algicola]MCF2905322.1 hypothetical protein [Octadecabacter algicola]
MQLHAEALTIAQRALDETGAAIMSGEFAAIEKTFALPALFGTFEGEVIIKTVQELAARFADVRAHHRSLGVTEIVRNIIECDWHDEKTIHTMYQSRLLSGNILVQAPYNTLTNLKIIDGEWKCSSMLITIPDSEKHNEALLGGSQLGDDT